MAIIAICCNWLHYGCESVFTVFCSIGIILMLFTNMVFTNMVSLIDLDEWSTPIIKRFIKKANILYDLYKNALTNIPDVFYIE